MERKEISGTENIKGVKMTGEELVKMWAEESNAANDCVISILESYLEFAELVEKHAELRAENVLLALAKRRKQDWIPILEHAKKAKEKAENYDKENRDTNI